MTAAGDAVLAMARGQIGVAEDPPHSSNVPYWDWWGSPAAGAWCAVFVSWCQWHAAAPCCALDGPMGFTYVPNGTAHSYPEGEAQPTLDLQPGDAVLFSWYGWGFDGGVPVINDGSEWTGWTAGDHTGIVASPPDGDGYFCAVEGNTSSTSWDNGGEVRERCDRHVSQVCGWWRPPSYGTLPVDPTPPEPPKPTYPLTEIGMFILANATKGAWLVGAGYSRHLDPEEYGQVVLVPGMAVFDTGDNPRAFDVVWNACMNGATAADDKIGKVRLVDGKGALWFTDFTTVVHAPTPEVVTHFTNLDWLDNDRDGGGNAIAQVVPDAVIDALVTLSDTP